MDPTLRELVDLFLRWMHLIAGIMWIGNSLLWNWLDRNLLQRADAPSGFEGEIWLVHSGSFYQMEKKQLAPHQMPRVLHWFKWQSYTTWMTGFLLLWFVYYLGEGFLVDPGVAQISHWQGVGIGLGTLVGGFVVYDLVWRSPLRNRSRIAVALCFVLLAGVVWELTHLLSGRAAYIHVGALLGTIMSGNVFFHIIPSQKELVAATLAGKTQDLKLGKHAKQRSIHNNYMTFPVLFVMISNHFPSTYGNALNWLVLAVIFVGGATMRHVMNVRFTWKPWLGAAAATFALTAGALLFLFLRRPASAATDTTAAVDAKDKVSFTEVQIVIHQRCVPCHSKTPRQQDQKVAPNNVMFDTPDQIKMYSERIKTRAVINKTMPLNNRTGMTAEERNLLARWFVQGASVAE